VGALQLLPADAEPEALHSIDATPLDDAGIARLLRDTTRRVPLGQHAEDDDLRLSLVVERFDRRLAPDERWIIRLPQEDFCQALGISALSKYQADGGPGIADIMTVLAGSEAAAHDRRNFFKTQILFWLLAATDGHAKNFSLSIGPGGRYWSTPLYDVLSAYPILGGGANQIAPQKARLAMAVRGSQNHYRLAQIVPRHWFEQGRQVGMTVDDVEAILAELAAATESAIGQTAAALPPGFPADVAETVFAGLRAQVRRLG